MRISAIEQGHKWFWSGVGMDLEWGWRII